MRQFAAVVLLALSALACDSLLSRQVGLALTKVPIDEDACHGITWIVDLVADATFGTAYRDASEPEHAGPLYWPAGYTGWRRGTQVEVRDPNGVVVAMTGGRYILSLAITPTGADREGMIASAACVRAWPAGATIPP